MRTGKNRQNAAQSIPPPVGCHFRQPLFLWSTMDQHHGEVIVLRSRQGVLRVHSRVEYPAFSLTEKVSDSDRRLEPRLPRRGHHGAPGAYAGRDSWCSSGSSGVLRT
jgi:hypothetical protein